MLMFCCCVIEVFGEMPIYKSENYESGKIDKEPYYCYFVYHWSKFRYFTFELRVCETHFLSNLQFILVLYAIPRFAPVIWCVDGVL